MSPTSKPKEKDRTRYALNVTLAVVAGQVGCFTTLIVVAALLVGLWLDSRFETRPLFTIIFIAGSVPVTVGAMLWIVRKATSRIRTNSRTIKTDSIQEDEKRGRDD